MASSVGPESILEGMLSLMCCRTSSLKHFIRTGVSATGLEVYNLKNIYLTSSDSLFIHFFSWRSSSSMI